MTIEGVIVVIFGRWGCVNHGPSTVDASLDFRGSANERPSKRGSNRGATRNRTSSPVHCKVVRIIDTEAVSLDSFFSDDSTHEGNY